LGPAGVGKTRLALEVACDLLERRGQPVWYVPLASVAEAAHVPGAILRVLQPGGTGTGESIERLLGAIGGEPCWLVLDNLEHLLPQASQLLGQLLDACRVLRCLATSQKATGLPGEKRYLLGPLPTPSAAVDTGTLMTYPSVQLFVERVQAIVPSFEIASGNWGSVQALCGRLEGFPLALVLAAGRAGVLGLDRLSEWVDRRFDLLADASRDSSDRHRSLGAALQSNATLVSEKGRRLLACLSVFRGGCALGAAEEVSQAADATDLIAELVGCSLLVAEVCGERLRVQMLETVREFAAGLVSAPELEDCRRRHALYFARLADEVVPKVGGPEGAALLRMLDSDLDNLRAAIAWALTADTECALVLAGSLGPYWEIRGLWREGQQTLVETVACAPNAPASLRGKALHQLGWLTHLLGDSDRARDYLERALQIMRDAGDSPREGSITYALATLARVQRRFDDAWRLLERCLQISTGDDSGTMLALCLCGMAGIEVIRGNHDEARSLYQQSLDQWHRVGSARGRAVTLWNMGLAAEDREHWAEARQYHEEGLALSRAVEDPVSTAWSLGALARIAWRCDRLAEARTLIGDALRTMGSAGTPADMARLLLRAGQMALADGDYAAARAHLEESLAVFQALSDHAGAEKARDELARLASSQDHESVPAAASGATAPDTPAISHP
jgi:non-specific serine/threonine protein kinase